MSNSPNLSPGMQQFIESMGIYFEHLEMPRIAGRILGLLMVAARPLSLDDMASALQVSRASASTNIRLAMNFGAAELVGLPGDRHDYYRLTADLWERHIMRGIGLTSMMRRIADGGLAVLEPGDDVARARLEEMRAFCDFSLQELEGMVARWQASRAATASAQPISGELTARPLPPDGETHGITARAG